MCPPEWERNTSIYIIHGFYAEEKSKNAPNCRNRAAAPKGGDDPVPEQAANQISSIIQGDSVKKALIFHGRYE